jgi:hypothetical protein
MRQVAQIYFIFFVAHFAVTVPNGVKDSLIGVFQIWTTGIIVVHSSDTT